MLSKQQQVFRTSFLSPFKQRLYFLKELPMALICGIRLTCLDEEKAVAIVPCRWLNKNPFHSIYFAVLSMAAELSTAAPVMMVLKASDISVALIIVDLKAEFVKKAQSTISFTCVDYHKIPVAIAQLKQAGDTATIQMKTVGRDVDGDEVASFYFTWSFKRRF